MVKRHPLSRKDFKKLAGEAPWITSVYGPSPTVELLELDDGTQIYRVNNEWALVKATLKELNKDVTYPTLLAANKYDAVKGFYPRARVDEGAVKPIATGADVMRPGIVGFEGNFKAGDVVLVESPGGRVIAVAVSLYDRQAVEGMQRGKVLLNIHYINDRVWKIMSGGS